MESLRSTVCQLPTSEPGGDWGGSAPVSRTWWAELLQAGPCPGSEGKCARVGQKGKLSQERSPPNPSGRPQQHPAALRFTWHGLQKRRLFSG